MLLLDHASAIVPPLALVPAKPAGWLPKAERVPLPRMICRQLPRTPKWCQRLVKDVYYARAEVYPIDDRGGIAMMDELGAIHPMTKRSKFHGAMQVPFDALASTRSESSTSSRSASTRRSPP